MSWRRSVHCGMDLQCATTASPMMLVGKSQIFLERGHWYHRRGLQLAGGHSLVGTEETVHSVGGDWATGAL